MSEERESVIWPTVGTSFAGLRPKERGVVDQVNAVIEQGGAYHFRVRAKDGNVYSIKYEPSIKDWIIHMAGTN